MHFRQVLMELDEYQAKGVVGVSSVLLSSVMRCRTAQASKQLGRMHGMGFLVRKKHRRQCLSKHGKFCYKGYCYQYSLSNQGRRYVEWMRSGRPAREAFYGEMIQEGAAYLSKDEKSVLASFGLYRWKMRYSGPSRDAQEFGFLTSYAFPRLTRKLGEMSAQNERLEVKKALSELKCNQLQGKVDDQARMIRQLEDEKEELVAKAERDAKQKDQMFQKVVSYLFEKFFEMSLSLDSATDIIDGWSSLSHAKEGVIREIGTFLALWSGKPEKVAELLGLVADGHRIEVSRAKDCVRRARQTLQVAQKRE